MVNYMKLNKKFIIICSILIFLLLFVNISYTDTKEFITNMCIILLISFVISFIINFIVEVIKKLLS